MRSTLRRTFLLTLLIAPALCRAQSERILDFHSDVTLQDDGTLVVRESIRVFASGNQIRHGIFRDFPTRYRDPLGNRYGVGFEVSSATRDEAPEAFRVTDYSNGKRVYLGSADSYVPRGEHTYTISYTTNRQLGFFADHDELFWNVTGNGWGFVIDHASATVRLPEKIPASEVRLSGFTGQQGSRERDLSTSTEDNAFHFAAKSWLAPQSGLSILLTWPKGYIREPTAQERVDYFLRDNRDAGWAVAALLVLGVYYVFVWSAVGRDPQRGIIVPRYEPPVNLSPAAMRYLVRMGYDNKVLTAAIVDMAVRGFLTIQEEFGTYTLKRTQADDRALFPDEKDIASALFNGRGSLLLQNHNHTVISGGIATLKAWLKTAEEKIYFVRNSRYMIPAIVFSVAVVVAMVLRQGGEKLVLSGFLSLWLSLWSLGLGCLVYACYQQWKAVFSGTHHRVTLFGKALVFSLFVLPFLGGEVLGLFFLSMSSSWFVVAFLVASVAVHIVFHFLLKAPTSAGRMLLDQVEGFKMFLSEVDGDRLNRVMPPEKTPQTFEKFLPYAVALDVEQAWADKFSGVLASAGQAPAASTSYTPSFYSGNGWSGSSSFSGFTDSLGSFGSAISSASSAPGSSSGGGGGGGSGGGGGGGGGGGW